MSIKLRLIILNFLQFAVWGAYLISMGRYLGSIDFSGVQIGSFYGMQGIVSLFMPAFMWRIDGYQHRDCSVFVISWQPSSCVELGRTRIRLSLFSTYRSISYTA